MATYTIGDALTTARQILQDVDTPTRHSDTKLIGYLNNALSDIKRLRADLFIGAPADWVLYTSADTALDFPIDHTYFTAVVDFIVSMTEIGDDEFSNSGRAQALQQRFIMKLTGKLA